MSTDNATQTDEIVRTEKDIDEPARYKVLLHNDNYTTQDFVVAILCKIFNKSIQEATDIMLRVHNTGIGVCGTYTKEIAETKVKQVKIDARLAGYPLKCTMEKE